MGRGASVAGRIARGEVRLCQFALPDKERPVVVLTRASSLDVLSTVTIAPITSTVRGIASQVVLNEADGMKSTCAVNLHNLQTVARRAVWENAWPSSARRVSEKFAQRWDMPWAAIATEPPRTLGVARDAKFGALSGGNAPGHTGSVVGDADLPVWPEQDDASVAVEACI